MQVFTLVSKVVGKQNMKLTREAKKNISKNIPSKKKKMPQRKNSMYFFAFFTEIKKSVIFCHIQAYTNNPYPFAIFIHPNKIFPSSQHYSITEIRIH